MSTLIQDVYDFNYKAGFLGKGMDSFLETAYILEEAVEGYEDVFNNIDDKSAPIITARIWALGFLNQVKLAKEQRNLPMPTEVAEVDKAIDGVIFNIGKLAKMDLTVDQIDRMFKVVTNANAAKIGAPKDELGKQLKPDGWVGPEALLQKILDERPPKETDVTK